MNQSKRSSSVVEVMVFAGLMFSSFFSFAEDWPQYRGPFLDGTTTEKIGLTTWPAEGPKVLWRIPAPLGFSSFTISQGQAFTLVARPDQEGITREVAVAVDASSGKELWSFSMCIMKYDGGGDSGSETNSGGDGPRSTPSIDGDRVYLYDSQLNLYCLGLKDGKTLWQHSVQDEFEGRNIRWQSSASVLIEGDLAIVPGGGAGQSFLAFNKKTGDLAWKSSDQLMTHATSVPATIHGVRQIIFFTQSGLVSVDASNGKELWNYPFPYKISTAASPVVNGDKVYCSAGYGVGAGYCQIRKTDQGFTAEEIWRRPNGLVNHWSTPVLHQGFLFGMFSFKEHGRGPLKCVDLEAGKEIWEKDGYGPGNVILTGNCLVALADDGHLVLIEPSSSEYKELARAKVVSGKCWSTPTLSNGRLFVRSTVEGVCLDVSR